MAPVSGILVHAIEVDRLQRLGPEAAGALQLSRLSFDILGMIAAQDFDIDVQVIRPGRTIELVEATMTVAGRAVVRARAWWLSRQDTSAVAGGAPPPLPAPHELAVWDGSSTWPGGFIASLQIRPVGQPEPGRGTAWISTASDLLAGEPVSALARFVGLVDTANGVAVRASPRAWMYPNVDLTIHLYRQPVGEYVGLDTTVVFGDAGLGVTSSVLHDLAGPVGRAEQQLTVRPMPPA